MKNTPNRNPFKNVPRKRAELRRYPSREKNIYFTGDGKAYEMEDKDITKLFIYANEPKKIKSSKKLAPGELGEILWEESKSEKSELIAYINEANEIVIKEPFRIIPLFKSVDTDDFWTIKDYAEKYGYTDTSWIKRLCQKGRIPGATKIGRIWYMPKNTPKVKNERRYNRRQDAKLK